MTWDGSQWYPMERDSSVYNDKNFQVMHINQSWDGFEWQTMSAEKNEITYNSAGLAQQMTSYYLDMYGNWVGTTRITATFSNPEKYDEALIAMWSDTAKEFQDYVKMTDLALYNNNFETPTKYIIKFPIGNGMWINAMRYTASYNSEGKMLSDLEETFSVSGWEPSYRTTNKYDAFGNATQELYEVSEDGKWMALSGSRKYKLSYNTSKNLLKEKEISEYNESSKQYEISEKLVYMYTGITSIHSDVEALSATAYPNPVNDMLTIRFTAKGKAILNVVDATGRTMYTENVAANSDNTTINTQNWNTGVYYLRISTESGSHLTKTIVKQ